VPLFMSILAFFFFLRTPGANSVRAVQILLLLASGMCLGVGWKTLIAGGGGGAGD
jgi:hypothetical protein